MRKSHSCQSVRCLALPCSFNQTPGGFQGPIPSGWQLQPTDPNLKGQRFASPDGEGSLALYATSAEQEPIAKHMNAIAFVEGEQITHLRGEEDWIEVAGFKADHSFYRKAVLACAGRVWHEVAFEYPTQSLEEITKFVSRAAKAVRNSEDQGCEASESSVVDEPPAEDSQDGQGRRTGSDRSPTTH